MNCPKVPLFGMFAHGELGPTKGVPVVVADEAQTSHRVQATSFTLWVSHRIIPRINTSQFSIDSSNSSALFPFDFFPFRNVSLLAQKRNLCVLFVGTSSRARRALHDLRLGSLLLRPGEKSCHSEGDLCSMWGDIGEPS